MPTDTRWTIAVAIVMPSRTGQTLNRVAKVSAMSWDLSPSSGTKMTPNETTVLMKTASTGDAGPSVRPGRGRETSTRQSSAWIEGLARLAGTRPIGRTGTRACQCVDRVVGGYSPSLRPRYRGRRRRSRPGRGDRPHPCGRDLLPHRVDRRSSRDDDLPTPPATAEERPTRGR